MEWRLWAFVYLRCFLLLLVWRERLEVSCLVELFEFRVERITFRVELFMVFTTVVATGVFREHFSIPVV